MSVFVMMRAIAIRAAWRESLNLKDRRRRNRPETLRHTNGRLSRSLESDRGSSGDPPKGSRACQSVQSLRSQGQRGKAHRCLCRLYFRREVAMGLKTALHDTHILQGAKIVDFGGWEMPLHYGSQIEEHHAVRRDAGMFDVSHMGVVDLKGHRVREFLRMLLANDAARLKVP